MYSITINETTSALGKSYNSNVTVEADGALSKSVIVAAAKTGQLTTRTSGTVGTLTMAGGHGITTGARLDIYWSGGHRRGVTVGTVATNSVPFTLGEGDDLPDNLTAITAMVPVEEEFLVTGDNVKALLAYGQRRGLVVLAESDDGEATHRELTSTVRSRIWTPDRDATNPVASADVAKVFFSHADSANTAEMRVAVLYD